MPKKRTVNTSSPPPGITLRDVAKKLGIHHSTVGRALHNAPNISLERRKEIHEVARQMGYRPNAIATILGHQRQAQGKRPISSEIAWINYWSDPKKLRKHREFDLYWKGASTRAELSGYRLEEFSTQDRMSPSRLEQILLARNIRGILVPPHGRNWLPDRADKIHWEKFCLVRFGYSIPTLHAHLVSSNHLTSGVLAVENMWRLGYRRIGFVALPYRFMQFQAGFFVKQAEFGMNLKTSFFTMEQDEDPAIQLSRMAAWLKKNRPEAILTDVAELHEMLLKLGYRVPDDIGLAATSVLDGNADAGIDQNSEEIGKAAMDTLISLLNHNEYGIPEVVREVLITGKWVDGKTLPPRTPA